MNIVEDFLKNLEDNVVSPLTIKNYRIDLVQVLPLIIEKPLDKITVDDLKMVTVLQTRNKLLKLQEDRNYSVTTINRRLASLKSLYTYYSTLNNFPNVIRQMKAFNDTRLHEIEFIKNDDVKRIVNKAKEENDYEMYYILGMLFNTGLRSSELLSLTKNNIHEDCIIVEGKGGKMRQIELNSIAKDCIETFLKTRHITNEERILDMQYVTLRRHFEKFLDKCGIKCSKLHTTRKSFTTNLIEKGGRDVIQDVAKLLGHSSSVTLEQHYLGSSTKKITVGLLD